MTDHHDAWELLPDLVTDPGGDRRLLRHVRACHACQRRLFALERVDRALRQPGTAPAAAGPRRRRRAAFAVAAAVAAGVLAWSLAPAGDGWSRELALHTASGAVVAHATLVGGRAPSLTLVADGLPAGADQGYLLWAQLPGAGPGQVVGRFMADPAGRCVVAVPLVRAERHARLWITPADQPDATVAST
ncbi:MAG: hypothetical protein R3C15_23720 [Thermoleophilia bacterium]